MKSNGKITILDYFIFSYAMNESEYHLFVMNRNPTYKCNLVSIIIIFLFIPTFIKFIRTWNEEENNYDVYYHSSFLCTKQPFKVLA